jgi:ubiquinone/menaquinone biosynthesis C-methylase UbiE
MGHRPHEPREAASDHRVMSIRTRIFAAMYDHQVTKMEREGLGDIRRRTVGEASGRVLEIGAGTGANLEHYGPNVTSLTLTDPEQPMLKRLAPRVRDTARQATVLRAPAEDLPFDEDSFDTVVSTLVLCGVSDQARSLREVRRVLRPGGKLIFVEHVRSEEPKLARLQDRMNGLNRFVVCCECNRPTLESITAAGFSIDRVEHGTLPKAPKFARPLVAGVATN